MARAKRPDRDGVQPPDPLAPIVAFLGAVESGAFAEQAEAARTAHCELCRRNAAASARERDAACDGARCFLRHGEMWLYEYGWVRAIGGTSLLVGKPKPEDLREFNQHIGEAACVVYGVKEDYATGALMTYPHAPTLRGMVHAGLVQAITWRADNRQHNIYLTTGEELRALVGRERDDLDERDMGERQRQAATMRDEGATDAQIADALGRSDKAVRDWLGPKRTWLARRADWWARHGENRR